MKIWVSLLCFALAASAVAGVPSFMMRRAIAKPNPRLPDAVFSANRGKTLDGSYRVCTATDGTVTRVEVVHSIAGADDAIISHIRTTWRFEGGAPPVCSVERLIFQVTPPATK